jgi:hypothetical protein
VALQHHERRNRLRDAGMLQRDHAGRRGLKLTLPFGFVRRLVRA